MPAPASPETLEEDEAELELQKQLEKGRRLRQLQQLRDSGEKVSRRLAPAVLCVPAGGCPQCSVDSSERAVTPRAWGCWVPWL